PGGGMPLDGASGAGTSRGSTVGGGALWDGRFEGRHAARDAAGMFPTGTPDTIRPPIGSPHTDTPGNSEPWSSTAQDGTSQDSRFEGRHAGADAVGGFSAHLADTDRFG